MKFDESQMIPVGDRIIVKVDKMEKKTAGGVIIPDFAAEKEDRAATTATVIALGETANCDGLKVFPKAGDKILMTKWAGTGHTSPEYEDYRAIPGIDVIAILPPEEKEKS